jgi:uncharacterized protein with PIN domain
VTHATPRFIVDAMLGRLARWLRLLGYDTVYRAHCSDADLLRQAREEGRLLLTRDRALLREHPIDWALLVESTSPLLQLRQVVQQWALPWRQHLFSRCMLCNAELRAVCRQEVAHRVPAYVVQTQQRFVQCPACQRVYWQGTHVTHMYQQLQQLLADCLADGEDAEHG